MRFWIGTDRQIRRPFLANAKRLVPRMHDAVSPEIEHRIIATLGRLQPVAFSNLVIVDQVHRRPIGRPWLTLAIDVHTHMVAGFLVSLDPPQATSVALCLTHAVLPKEGWLSRYRIDASWPVWGRPDTIPWPAYTNLRIVPENDFRILTNYW